MSSKTRKLIWSVPLVATLAVVGALAVFVALDLPNANPAEAVGGTTASIDDQEVVLGMMGMIAGIQRAFDLAVGETVTYTALSSDEDVATVVDPIDSAGVVTVTYTGTGYGEATITVTATDSNDATDTADATFKVTVVGIELSGTSIDDVAVEADASDGNVSETDVTNAFTVGRVNGGDVPVSYEASSSDDSIVSPTATPFTGALTLDYGTKVGEATVSVTGTVFGLTDSATTSFEVTTYKAATGNTEADRGDLGAREVNVGSKISVSFAAIQGAVGSGGFTPSASNTSSDDTDVATIAFGDTTVEISGKADGEATITFEDGGDTAVLKVAVGTGATAGVASETSFSSSSTSGSAGVELKLVVKLSADDVDKLDNDGGSIELYLEDDFSVPDSINRNDVYFIVTPERPETGDGGRIRAQYGVVVNDGDYFGGDDDWAIQVFIPDLQETSQETVDSLSQTVGAGFQGATPGSTITMVITKSAGIKNPSEAGTHSVGYRVLGVDEAPDKGTADNIQDVVTDDKADPVVKNIVETEAKISLSVDNGGRGKEVTVIGSGFNDKTEAEVFVLVAAAEDADAEPPVEKPSCTTIIEDGDSLGTATVGSDDKFSVAFTVHQDEFKPGAVNYICAEDDESPKNREASGVKTFTLNDSLTITPDTVSSGDEVTLKPRDFKGTLLSVDLGGQQSWDAAADVAPDKDHFMVKADGSSDYVFDMPGGLSGTIRITVKFDNGTPSDSDDDTSETSSITVSPSSLTLSKTEVAPNESIVISGNGFSEKSYILVSEITIDGQPIVVDEAGSEDLSTSDGLVRIVKTTSAGAFSASVNVWSDSTTDNPALNDGTYKIEVEDIDGFTGSTTVTVLEPTLMVNPTAAGPRDYITISGANWPVSTSDYDREVDIDVDGRDRNADIDSTGRFNFEYQLRATIQIGMEHTITVTYEDDGPGDITEEITFIVPSSNVMITPAAAAPGETIDLEMTGMPILRLVEDVIIDGVDRLGNQNVNTDRDGNVTVTNLLVPYADPGFYPVRIKVGEDTAVVQLEILAEADVRGAASPLPEAVTDLGDSVVRIFHFNTSSKVWTFYDPRPEFEGLNTLTELAAGQPYWILVSESVENVVLNGRTRNLTCVGGDCWNQLVW